MLPYFFLFKVAPASERPDVLPGAYAHVWIMDGDLDSARQRALNRVAAAGWQPLTTVNELQPDEGQLSQLAEQEAANYHRALHYGESAGYLACSMADHSPP